MLEPHKVGLSLGFVVLLTIVNLRGVRESGVLFALPTYGFVVVMFLMIGTGIGQCLDGTCPQAAVPDPLAAGAGVVGVLVILQAFASGSAALTGVEAISNGVGAFRRPKGRNAALTLLAMGGIAISLFLGVSYLAVSMNAAPSASVSVISEIARGVFPASSSTSFLYYAVQALTFAILILAANTSYQGFPRLAAVLAHDRFFPRQFVNLGDRLVYSNGIVVLAGIAALLIWAFKADVIALIHLYVIGVFTAFTISQAGMVRYWLRREQPGWRWRAVVNGTGAVATGIVALVVIESKFAQGAWAVTIAIPILVVCFYGIRRHYSKVARRLRAGVSAVAAAPPATNRVVLYVESYDAALQEAVWYARRIAGDDFEAIHVPGPHSDPGILPRFRQLTGMRPDLEIVAPEDGRVEAVIEHLWALPRGESSFVTLVVPELFKRRSFANALRRPEFSVKLRLLREPGVVVTDVPVLAQDRELELPERAVCRILVSGAHAATMRAANYAGTLDVSDTRAVFFASEAEEAERLRAEWAREEHAGTARDPGGPVPGHRRPAAAYLREITADPDAVAVVVSARARLQRPLALAAQPARALHQAPAALRAARDPRERPLSNGLIRPSP